MSSSNDQPVLHLPDLPKDDGHVDPPQLARGVDLKGPGKDGEIGEALGIILYSIWREVMDGVAKDNNGRGLFTQRMVSSMRQVWPEFNWIIVHTAHTKSFNGNYPNDWGYGHGDFDLSIGGVVGYEIYYCRSGIFALHGDGGFQNWAWVGSATQSSDGRILMFS